MAKKPTKRKKRALAMTSPSRRALLYQCRCGEWVLHGVDRQRAGIRITVNTAPLDTFTAEAAIRAGIRVVALSTSGELWASLSGVFPAGESLHGEHRCSLRKPGADPGGHRHAQQSTQEADRFAEAARRSRQVKDAFHEIADAGVRVGARNDRSTAGTPQY